MTSEILIRYGELALKSPSVRKYMEIKLAKNIEIMLKKHGIENYKIQIKRAWGRLIITFDESINTIENQIIEQIKSLLSKYGIGITSFSFAIKTSSDLEAIKQVAFEIAQKNLKSNTTFAVRARRIGKHNYNSKDLERLVGEVIFESLVEKRNLSVNLTNPDYTLFIEVKDEFAYLFDHKIKGFGGLPQSTHGIIAAVFRGSVEDALAAFLLAKRGSMIIPILFEIKNNEVSNLESLEEQLNYFEKLQPRKKLRYFKINFNDMIEKIGLKNLKCSICDEFCLRLANNLFKNQSINGLALGNAETALTDRKIITSYPTLNQPIYYPFISLSKKEINHPFDDNFKNRFCLDTCPGYDNEKKKNKKPLSQEELAQLVTEITSSLLSTNKT
ncbi:MAG: hypothetical protein FK730_10070 [Asgard group archaeon]|nr:hypothetical protein [Asgard group archaeon]